MSISKNLFIHKLPTEKATIPSSHPRKSGYVKSYFQRMLKHVPLLNQDPNIHTNLFHDLILSHELTTHIKPISKPQSRHLGSSTYIQSNFIFSKEIKINIGHYPWKNGSTSCLFINKYPNANHFFKTCIIKEKGPTFMNTAYLNPHKLKKFQYFRASTTILMQIFW